MQLKSLVPVRAFSGVVHRRNIPSHDGNDAIIDRYNPLLVQLLPDCIRKQLIKREDKVMRSNFAGPLDDAQVSSLINVSREHLEKHGLLKKPKDLGNFISASDKHVTAPLITSYRPKTHKDNLLEKFHFPELLGDGFERNSMDIHFKTILRSLYEKDIQRIHAFAKVTLTKKPESTDWILQTGWTRYTYIEKLKGFYTERVSFPEEGEDIVFDVEVACLNPRGNGLGPILAVAASSKAWYLWLSTDCFSKNVKEKTDEPEFATDKKIPVDLEKDSRFSAFNDDLIPIGNSKRIIVGHNVAYDRVRILEEYHLTDSKAIFVDTLSLHSCVGGLSGQQRIAWTKFKTSKKIKDNIDFESEPLPEATDESIFEGTQFVENKESDKTSFGSMPKWAQVSCKNSLKDCLELYCNIEIDKSPRNMFVKGTVQEIQENIISGINYCSEDVLNTHLLLKNIWDQFIQKSPSSLTLAALFLMGKTYLTTSTDWLSYLKTCETCREVSKLEISQKLKRIIEDIIAKYQVEDKWKFDAWLKHLDWTLIPIAYTKGTIRKKRPKVPKEVYQSLEYLKELAKLPFEVASVLKEDEYFSEFPKPKTNTLLFGKPKWYKDLWIEKEHDIVISPGMKIVPYILRLTWEGNPVHYIEGYGWTFLSLRNDGKGTVITVSDGNAYQKIPQIDTSSKSLNVGSLFAKAFIIAFGDGRLATEGHHDFLSSMMDSYRKLSFWNSIRSRCFAQILVDDPALIGFSQSSYSCRNLISSDLSCGNSSSGGKAAVILPHFIPMGTVTRRAVEPLWLTATNASDNLVGSEVKSMIIAPKGWKIVGADVDSQELWLASLFGDSLLGQHGSTAISWMNLLGDKASGTDLHTKTANILGITRNQSKVFNYGRIYGAGVSFASSLLKSFNEDCSPREVDKKAQELYEKTKGKKVRPSMYENFPFFRKLFHGDILTSFFQGGTESLMFNELERIALSPEPRTALSNTCISNALQSGNVGTEYMTSRINWIVQSSAVDYLHCLLVSVDYLTKLYNIPARLLLSIHDEVRFLVKEEFQYEMAFILQVANCWTRLYFSQTLGIQDLPLNVAFFSAVDIDFVLRKEVTQPCTSPSNLNMYPPGESLDIYQLLEKTTSLGVVKNELLYSVVKENENVVNALISYSPRNAIMTFRELLTWITLQEKGF